LAAILSISANNASKLSRKQEKHCSFANNKNYEIMKSYLLAGLLIIVIFSCSTPKTIVSYEKVVLQNYKKDSTETGFNKSILEEMYQKIATHKDFKIAQSMLIVKDGTLMSEAYFNGTEKNQRQNVKSVTKSIVSLLVGIAIDQNYISGLSLTVEDVFPEYLVKNKDNRKPGINLHHMLTMQTGLKWYENMEWFFNISWDPNWMFRSKNSARYVLSLDMEDIPGGHFHYSTGTSQLVAATLQRKTGKHLLEFANENLFNPMKIKDVVWEAGKDGINYGGVFLHLSPRELAMIGQLCLQKGMWDGNQLISKDWIELSTRSHITLNDGAYGYHWWVSPFGYSAQGYGGQYIYVIPDHELVVVFTAKNNKPTHVSPAKVEELILNYILKAFEEG
jgi:CubicO group peptidase (beta-lactamase class C family)